MRRTPMVYEIIGLMLFALPTLARAADHTDGDRIPNTDVLRKVSPQYPLEARRKHQTGRGILVLNVDHRTGEVTSVTIRKSTGYKLLDDAGLRAFSQWRFRPGRVSLPIWIPISFSMR